MGYWREIAKSVGRQALKDAKLDSAVSAVIALLAQALIAFGIFIGLGQFTEATAVTRALTALTPFLTFPVAFVIRFAFAPALHFQALQAETEENAGRLQARINHLENPPPPDGKNETIYQDGNAVGNVVGAITRKGPLLIFDEIENCTADLGRAFVFMDEILYFQRERNSAQMIMGGPIPRINVRTGVEAFALGTLSSVRIPV